MNNGLHGKTVENLRNTVDLRLTNAKYCQKLVSKPRFVSQKIFNKNLAALHKIKEVLMLNKPAYAGVSILDLSKTLCDFPYDYVQDNMSVKLNYCLQTLIVYDMKLKQMKCMKI